MQELSARRLWVCPLWDVECAAGSDVLACGAACSPRERGRPLQRGSAHWHLASLARAAVTSRFYGSAPPRDSCCFHFTFLDQLLHGLSNRRGQLLEAQLLSFSRSVMRLFHFAEGSLPAALPGFVTLPILMHSSPGPSTHTFHPAAGHKSLQFRAEFIREFLRQDSVPV